MSAADSTLPHLPEVPLIDCAPLPTVSEDAVCVVMKTMFGTVLVGCRSYSTSFVPYIQHDVEYVVSLDNQVSCFAVSPSVFKFFLCFLRSSTSVKRLMVTVC